MTENEQKEIIALKEDMDKVGEKNMGKERKNRYVFLRQIQKKERRDSEEMVRRERKQVESSGTNITVLFYLVSLIFAYFIPALSFLTQRVYLSFRVAFGN